MINPISTPFASVRMMNLIETVLALALIAVVVGGLIGWCAFIGGKL